MSRLYHKRIEDNLKRHNEALKEAEEKAAEIETEGDIEDLEESAGKSKRLMMAWEKLNKQTPKNGFIPTLTPTVGRKVTHPTFGAGKVSSFGDTGVSVNFGGDVKKFSKGEATNLFKIWPKSFNMATEEVEDELVEGPFDGKVKVKDFPTKGVKDMGKKKKKKSRK